MDVTLTDKRRQRVLVKDMDMKTVKKLQWNPLSIPLKWPKLSFYVTSSELSVLDLFITNFTYGTFTLFHCFSGQHLSIPSSGTKLDEKVAKKLQTCLTL